MPTKTLKVTVVGTVAPDRCYPDADTGELVTPDPQASEPIRVLPQGTPEPGPPDERRLEYIRKVLAYEPRSKAKYLGPLIGATDDEAALAMIQRGDQFVLNHYIEREWAAEREAWAEKERKRHESRRFWIYRNKIVEVEGWSGASREEIVTRVKHRVLSAEKTHSKLKREIDLLLKLENSPSSRRESIPEDVRVFVWRRDHGRCVRCGSQERIEFDHIIPLEKGGGNTARNIQVLCERCNREKGTSL